jgi:hypothetical protein
LDVIVLGSYEQSFTLTSSSGQYLLQINKLIDVTNGNLAVIQCTF